MIPQRIGMDATIIKTQRIGINVFNRVAVTSLPHLDKAIQSLDADLKDITGVREDSILLGGGFDTQGAYNTIASTTISGTLSGAWSVSIQVYRHTYLTYDRKIVFSSSTGGNFNISVIRDRISFYFYDDDGNIYNTGTLYGMLPSQEHGTLTCGVDSDGYLFVDWNGSTTTTTTQVNSGYTTTFNASTLNLGGTSITSPTYLYIYNFKFLDHEWIFEGQKGWDISGNANHMIYTSTGSSPDDYIVSSIYARSIPNEYGYNLDGSGYIVPADPNNPTLDLAGNTLVDYVGKVKYNPTGTLTALTQPSAPAIWRASQNFTTNPFFSGETPTEVDITSLANNYESKNVFFKKSDDTEATIYDLTKLSESDISDIVAYFGS